MNERTTHSAPADEEAPLMVEKSSSMTNSSSTSSSSSTSKEHHSSSSSSSLFPAFESLRMQFQNWAKASQHYILLLANVAAWYTTNGMNGIAMQNLASGVREEASVMESLLTVAAITSIVTALQLVLGAIMGCGLLYVHQKLNPSPSQQSQQQQQSQPPLLHLPKSVPHMILAALHGLGSICTNLGFMYGSASLVQIIKLLEPFETVLFTRLLLPAESKLLNLGVTSSMTLTVGAAVSLIQSRKKSPHPNAIVFAILSGLTLSTRNVLQRKQHASNSASGADSRSSTKQQNTTATATTTLDSRRKVEKSLTQFTQLSWQSGIVMALLSILLHVALHLNSTLTTTTTATSVATTTTTTLISTQQALLLTVHGLNWRVLTWHPLYNAFSMITLGFCSALTHSLLNAGKRVFAIVMAIVWFREAFSRATALGLFLVFCGGCWYTVESKANSSNTNKQQQSQSQQQQQQSQQGTTAVGMMVGAAAAAAAASTTTATTTRVWVHWLKPMASLVLLQFIYMVHALDQMETSPY